MFKSLNSSPKLESRDSFSSFKRLLKEQKIKFDHHEIQQIKEENFNLFVENLKNLKINSIIAKDLPRLKDNITIENSKKEEKISNSTADFLFNLSRFLKTKSTEDVEKFEESYKQVKPEYESLLQFLLDYYGETSKELFILSLITQKTLAQPIIYFKRIFKLLDVNFLDKEWKIEIKNQDEKFITISHQRTERIWVKKSNGRIDLCNFKWEMNIEIKQTKDDLALYKAEFKFVSIENFDENVETDLTEEKLTKIMKVGFSTLESNIYFH